MKNAKSEKDKKLALAMRENLIKRKEQASKKKSSSKNISKNNKEKK